MFSSKDIILSLESFIINTSFLINYSKGDKKELKNMNIEKLQDYLSKLNDYFYKTKNSFEKMMILSKINELVFLLEMYKEKQADNDL